MNEEIIKKYKKLYLETEVPKHLAEKGFEDLKFRLPEQDKPRRSVYRYGLLFASFFLVISAATVSASQYAKEGDFLYPVRAISESVTESFNYNIGQEKYKENKAKEISPTSSPTLTPGISKMNEDKKNNDVIDKQSDQQIKENMNSKKTNLENDDSTKREVRGERSEKEKPADNSKPTHTQEKLDMKQKESGEKSENRQDTRDKNTGDFKNKSVN